MLYQPFEHCRRKYTRKIVYVHNYPFICTWKTTNMTRKVRLIDIAKKANVSLGTVDRVVNGRGNVALDTEARVKLILKEFNYQPNMMASSLASRKKLKLAVLLPEPIGEDYWHKIIRGIRKAEKDIAGFGVETSYFLYEQYDDLKFSSFAGEIIKGGFNGLLTAPVFRKETRALVTDLEKHEIPYVFIDQGIEGVRPLCSISQDDFQSGRLGAKLLDFGLGRGEEALMVSIILHPENPEHILARLSGFKDYFKHEGRLERVIHQLEIINPKYEMLSDALGGILAKHPAIQGIFINNSKAHMIARYLDEHKLLGKRLIGYDLIEPNVCALRKGSIDFLIYDHSETQGKIGMNILFGYLAKQNPSPYHINMPVHIATSENIDGILPEENQF